MHHPAGGHIVDRQAIQIGHQTGHARVVTEEYGRAQLIIQSSDELLQLGGTGMVEIFGSLNLIRRKTDLFGNNLGSCYCPQGGATYSGIGADTPPLQTLAHLRGIA